jgi:hypothetical protein
MTTTTDVAAPPRNIALIAARVLGGVVGSLQVAGASYFMFVAPDEAVWLGLWIDIPVLTVLFTGMLLTLVMALAPGLEQLRRVRVGLIAVGLVVVATLVKIPLYDEPESVTVLGVEAVLLTLLLLAGRTAQATTR